MLKVHGLVLGFLLGWGSLISAQAAPMKIGVVNFQDVLDTIEEGKKAKNQMEKAVLKRKRELESKQKEYRKLEDSYDKQKLVLSKSALEQKRKELEIKRAELQRSVLNAQTEMQKKELELTGGIIKKIRAVVEKIGRKGGFDLVLEKNEAGVAFFKESYDITQRVIREYNRAYKK